MGQRSRQLLQNVAQVAERTLHSLLPLTSSYAITGRGIASSSLLYRY